MQGPVALERRAEGDSPALEASARRLSFNVDDDIQTLRGDVTVTSEGRTSEADILELDEDAGFAILRGSPARSRNEEGEVVGEVIEYDLDSNDVVVRQGVEATFELDLGADDTDVAPPPEDVGDDVEDPEGDPTDPGG
jgi:lipopolysaccharide assembly outer membrane protein LptD (OstA)